MIGERPGTSELGQNYRNYARTIFFLVLEKSAIYSTSSRILATYRNAVRSVGADQCRCWSVADGVPDYDGSQATRTPKTP